MSEHALPLGVTQAPITTKDQIDAFVQGQQWTTPTPTPNQTQLIETVQMLTTALGRANQVLAEQALRINTLNESVHIVASQLANVLHVYAYGDPLEFVKLIESMAVQAGLGHNTTGKAAH